MNDERLTDIKSLARRAVACNRWRWIPGMRWVAYRLAPLKPVFGRVADTRPRDGGDVLPDLSDPATVGCLLALVRKAWGDRRLVAVPMSGGRWGVAISTVMREGPRHCGATEVEALIKALEAAP